MRRIAFLAVVAFVSMPATVFAQSSGEAAVPESATPPPIVVVEAGTPVPVPLDAVADRLRAELQTVPVEVGPMGSGAAANAARVTLALSPTGELRVVYRDESGRIASRIVADTHDPQAVAAAVAMIVANLHRSQVGDALAAIGPAPAAPPVAAPPPPPAPPAPPAPPVAPPAPAAPVVFVVSAPKPQVAVAARAVTAVARPTRWGFSAAPSFDYIAGSENPLFGVETGVDFSFGPWRAELAFEYGVVPVDSYTFDVEYTHTMALLRLRRMFPLTGRITVSGAAGLGLIVSSLTPGWGWEWSESASGIDRSDLDALASLGGSLEVRLIGRTLFWTTLLEGVLTTADENEWRPISPQSMFRGTTGLRLAI